MPEEEVGSLLIWPFFKFGDFLLEKFDVSATFLMKCFSLFFAIFVAIKTEIYRLYLYIMKTIKCYIAYQKWTYSQPWQRYRKRVSSVLGLSLDASIKNLWHARHFGDLFMSESSLILGHFRQKFDFIFCELSFDNFDFYFVYFLSEKWHYRIATSNLFKISRQFPLVRYIFQTTTRWGFLFWDNNKLVTRCAHNSPINDFIWLFS